MILNFWKWLLAVMHWNDAAVCEMSRGEQDYHDFCDSETCNFPWHMVTFTCKRCGKKFYL